MQDAHEPASKPLWAIPAENFRLGIRQEKSVNRLRALRFHLEFKC